MNSISVITPSFNQGRFIERTLCSVINQNIPNMEFVVYDGGSTDETLSILTRYQERVRWVSERDRGQAHAVNKGIETTKGDIIAWINSDDIYYPGALKIIQQYFSDNQSENVVYGDAFHIDVDDNQIEPYYTRPWDFNQFKSSCFLCQPAVFFRRKMVEEFGLLDESLHFCMDYEYWLRLANNGVTFTYLHVPLAGSRMYEQNKTLSQRLPVHAEINDMLQKKFRKVPTKWVLNYAQIKVEEQKIPQGLWRLILISWQSILASFRWNHEISPDILRVIGNWLVRKYLGT